MPSDDLKFLLLLLVGLILILLVALLTLVFLLLRTGKENYVRSVMENRRLVHQNQSLLNQLRFQDPELLANQQYLTLPHPSESDPVVNPQDPLSDSSFLSDIEREAQLAREGFQVGDLSDDLSGQGWESPLLRTDESGRISTYQS